MPARKSAPRPAKAAATQQPSSPVPAPAKPRRLKLPPYKLFRLKRIKHPVRLPSVWQLSSKTCRTLWQYRRIFIGIAIVYAVLNILFVNGVSTGTDVSSLKQQLGQGANGNAGQLVTGLSVFSTLLASAGNGSSASAGAYEVFVGLVISLAAIWAVRQLLAGERIRLRDTFYKGMYPLIPFILVLVVVLLQTVPFLIGGGLYSLVVTNGIAVYLVEKLLWGLLFLVLAIISISMLCSSVFALYIVTLPDMTPLKALRSARQLVRYRRLSVFRKLLFLPLALLVCAATLMLPIILFLPGLAQVIFFVLSVCGLLIVHVYIYTLYRELLE